MMDLLNNFVYIPLFISLYFEVFLLITFFEGKRTIKTEEARSSREVPSVTLIVPCWNEETTVAHTLDSILALDYPKDKLTVVAVNDGSTDGTANVLQDYAERFGITVYTKENGGKHTALNLGISRAQSEIVGCLDADSTVAPNALREIIKYFDDPEAMAVTPSIQAWQPRTLLQRIQEAEYDMSIFLQKTLSMLGALTVTPGPFSFFRTRVFKELGPYRHAHSTEDMEYAMRMQKARYKIVNAHTAYVYTNTPKTFKGLYRQRRRWTYGFLANARDYRELFFKPRYGHAGVLTMPFRFFTVFSALILVSIIITNAIHSVLIKLSQWSAINYHNLFLSKSFDFFYVNPSTVVILEILTLMFAFILIVGGKNLAKKQLFSKDIIYFYGLLAPFWLGGAVWNFMRAKNVAWR